MFSIKSHAGIGLFHRIGPASSNSSGLMERSSGGSST